MGEYPSYDSPDKLLKDLRKQDFIIEETTDGYLVYSPHNKESTVIHRSSGHSLSNAKIADLKRMGFQPPGLKYMCPECKMRFAAPVTVSVHRGTTHGITWDCEICGEKFHNPHAKRGHVKTMHVLTLPELQKQIDEAIVPDEGEPEPTLPTSEPIKVRRGRAAPVKIGYVEDVSVIMEAAVELEAASTKMVAAYRELYKKYADQKRRLARIEDRLGKVIQDL